MLCSTFEYIIYFKIFLFPYLPFFSPLTAHTHFYISLWVWRMEDQRCVIFCCCCFATALVRNDRSVWHSSVINECYTRRLMRMGWADHGCTDFSKSLPPSPEMKHSIWSTSHDGSKLPHARTHTRTRGCTNIYTRTHTGNTLKHMLHSAAFSNSLCDINQSVTACTLRWNGCNGCPKCYHCRSRPSFWPFQAT